VKIFKFAGVYRDLVQARPAILVSIPCLFANAELQSDRPCTENDLGSGNRTRSR